MALAGEVAGASILGRSSLLPDPKILTLGMKRSSSLGSSTPSLFLVRRGKFASRSLRITRPPVATISEEVLSLVVGKPTKIQVRAVITVRKKSKEDFRDAIANQLDALSDKIGRNVGLELISTEINKSTLNSLILLSFSVYACVQFSDGDFLDLRNEDAEEERRGGD